MKDFNIIMGDPGIPRDDIDHWCREMWRMLREGGRWGIPRSGLLFEKRNGQLTLVASMPHVAEMPITAEQLKRQQDSDFNATVERFGRVGIQVVR